jgi:two-component system sensor histidine kinase BaeS
VPTSTRHRANRLAVRLAAVLVAVAIVSVLVFAAVVLLFDNADVNNAARQQQQATVTALVQAATSSYQDAGGWKGADLSALGTLAADNRLGVRLTTPTGAVITQHILPGPTAGVTHRPVRVKGSTVADLTVTYPPQTLSAVDRRLRSALQRAALAAGGVAIVVALICALVLSRKLTRPIRELTRAVRSHAAGEPIDLEPSRRGPGEIGELSTAFTSMVADLARNEQLRRSLVADIAHELRTPIAVLQAETEALIDGVADLTPAAIASLHEEVLRLARHVEDLRALAAARAAGLDMKPQRVDLAAIAATAGESQQRALHQAGLSWDTDLTPVIVHGDPLRLHQIATNLLTNAIKFSPAGSQVRLTVSVEDETAILRVEDTGPGITDSDLPHIFDRFWRGADHGALGSGIGLAVTAELVAAHHGTIQITTPPVGGTRATVRLPLAR